MDSQRTNFFYLIIFLVVIILISILFWENDTSKRVSTSTKNDSIDEKQGNIVDTHHLSLPSAPVHPACSHYRKQDDTLYTQIISDNPLILDEEAILYLAKHMVNDKVEFNKKIPAGYTFIGQFLAHDLTFNQTQNFEDQVNNKNKRTPYLDLDSVYGLGPDKRPDMYDNQRLKWNSDNNDLIRLKGVAIIPDERNDENVMISQTHLIFIRFHNKLVDSGLDYHAARQEVVWTYQFLIVNDFLFRFCTPKIVRKILARKSKLFEEASIPHEFSVAAFRFGHATLTDNISLNEDLKVGLSDLFVDNDEFHNINWAKFFGSEAQLTRTIGPHIVSPLASLPDSVGKPDDVSQNSLSLRNLKRSAQFKLCSGQLMSKYFDIRPLTSRQLERKYPETKKHGLSKQTPLWYYILAEAGIRSDGEHLGPLGATLVAEVVINLLKLDDRCYLYAKPWKSKFKNFDKLCEYVFT